MSNDQRNDFVNDSKEWGPVVAVIGGVLIAIALVAMIVEAII